MSSLGSVTSLGVGSNFELQDMLDQFREIDEAPINSKKTEKETLEERLIEFDEVNAKLLSIKSHALALSLQSNYLERDTTVSDEEILTASSIQGVTEAEYSLDIKALATRSSWQSPGVDSADTIAYIPTSAEATEGHSLTESVISEDGTMTVRYGTGETAVDIDVTLTKGMKLEDVKTAIELADTNGYLTTTINENIVDGKHYLRTSSADSATKVIVSYSPEDFSFKAPDALISYKVGDNEDLSVTIPPNTTFTELVSLINDDPNNTGVVASVIDDGTGEKSYHLILTAKETGEDYRISNITGMSMAEIQGNGTSLNAQITSNGIDIQRQSNNIDDIIDGVTLDIKKVGTASVSISAKTENIQTEIKGLIDSYNELVEEIQVNSVEDEETGEAGTLESATEIKGLIYDIQDIFSEKINIAGSYSSLFDLGLEINRDWTITLDEEALSTAISANPEDIQKLFLGDSESDITGIADIINDRLREITSSTGLVSIETDKAQARIDRLTTDIENATERLDRRYDVLAKQFVELDKYIGKMNSQAEYLSSMFDSFNSSSKSEK